MKNLGTLYYYELKKLLTRRLSWAAVLALTVFCAFAIVRRGNAGSGFTIPVMDESGNETGELRHISGEEIRDTYLKTAGALDGRVMDDGFFQEMLASLPNLKTLDREDLELDVYFWTEDATWHHVYNMVILSSGPNKLLPYPPTMPFPADHATASAYHAPGTTSEKLPLLATAGLPSLL